MASGVQVNPACLDAYQELKLGKKIRYIIYGLNKDNTEIVVEKTSDSKDYDTFLEEFKSDQCKYAVYDFEYEKEGGMRNKIAFYSWSPDEAKVKHKMVYASSKDALRRTLVGIAVEIQGTSFDEVSHEAVYEKASRGN